MVVRLCTAVDVDVDVVVHLVLVAVAMYGFWLWLVREGPHGGCKGGGLSAW